jgi:hypothetical protein
MTNNTPTTSTSRVSWEEFRAIAKTKGAPCVRMFQLSNGGDDIFTVVRDATGKVVDLVHDFRPIF